ncbi:hypothetical protein RM531_05340 [Salinisphaera sp. P385]|uniref:Uncharacterized protein n=1 Tax=Spectribacter acetivorans TaxID=3075603 RepID=A0ABU3B605_9GAMM|nr:hypothetical protein [Salinisphaera sp. P385]MDT0617887.1 hypothetical protein [Salinisphaera sp. P385]
MLIATAAVGLIAGCGGDDNERNTTGGSSNEIGNPVGNISGRIVSTNGVGVGDTTITIGSKSTTTDDSGSWEIEDVRVTGTLQDGTNPALSVAIEPPDGFLGATVQVTALASDDCSSQDGNAPGGDENPVCTFVDGFSVGTGPVPLPALSTTVRGVLRDADTGGFVPEGTTLTADFRAVVADQLALIGPGLVAAYGAGPTPVAEVGTDGAFEFTGVADDACYELAAAGFQLMYQNGNEVAQCNIGQVGAGTVTFTTLASEGDATIELSSLIATTNTNNDGVAPFVRTVSGVTVENVARGTLQSGLDGTQGISVTLSEPLVGPLTAGDIQVRIGAPPNVTPVPFDLTSSSANGFTVETADPIPAGTEFAIRISTLEAIDLAGNPLTTCDMSGGCPATNDQDPVDFDVLDGNFLVLNLQTFDPVNENADAVALMQINDQTDMDATAPFQSSSAFLDTVGDLGDINDAQDQDNNPVMVGSGPLNGQVRALNFDPMVAAGQFDPLADLFASAIPGGAVGDVATDIARVRVTLPADNVPEDLVVWVQRGNNVRDALVFPQAPAENVGQVCDNPPTCTTFNLVTTTGSSSSQVAVSDLGDGYRRYIIQPNGATEFDLFITGTRDVFTPGAGDLLEPGDHVVVASRADDGLLGGIAQAELGDNVVPTTGLQIGGASLPAMLSGANLSAGGAISVADSDRHTVLYPVTPQALDSVDAGNNGFDADNLQGEISSAEYPGNPDAGAVADFNAIGGVQAIDGNLSAVADATSMGVFGTDGFVNDLDRILGVNFTESVALTDTAPSYDGNAVLGNYLAVPNALDEDQAQTPGTGNILQLVRFDVDNILTLEADSRNAIDVAAQDLDMPTTIDFTNAVQDLEDPANVAGPDANARVVPVDINPPLMTRAFYDGSNFVFEFHEPINGNGTIHLLQCAPGVGEIDVNGALTAGMNPATLTENDTRLTVPVSYLNGLGGAINDINTCFPGPSYEEDAYSEANLAGATDLPAGAVDLEPSHGLIAYQSVADTAQGVGVTWADWQAAASADLGIHHSFFAGANVVGPFMITASECGVDFADGLAIGEDFQCDIEFNHPVALCDANAGQGGSESIYEQQFPGSAVAGAANLNNFCDGTDLLVEQNLIDLVLSIGDVIPNGNLDVVGVVARNGDGNNVLNPAGGGGDAALMGNSIRTVTITFEVAGVAVATDDEITLQDIGVNQEALIFSAFVPNITSAIDMEAFDMQKDDSFIAP